MPEVKKVNYLDQTRYPAIVLPLEKEFKDNYSITVRKMLFAISDKMTEIVNKEEEK